MDPSLLIVGTNAAGVGTAKELEEAVVITGGGATNGAGYAFLLTFSALRPLTPAINSEVWDLRNEAEEGLF